MEKLATPTVLMNSIGTVTARTGLGRSTVYAVIATGRLQSVKVGRRRLVTESALVEFINGLNEEAARAGWGSRKVAHDGDVEQWINDQHPGDAS